MSTMCCLSGFLDHSDGLWRETELFTKTCSIYAEQFMLLFVFFFQDLVVNFLNC